VKMGTARRNSKGEKREQGCDWRPGKNLGVLERKVWLAGSGKEDNLSGFVAEKIGDGVLYQRKCLSGEKEKKKRFFLLLRGGRPF